MLILYLYLGKESGSSDSDTIPGTSKEPSGQAISLEDGSKEGGDSVTTAQQNGIAEEEISQSNAEVREMASASENEGASPLTAADDEGCDTNKLDSVSKVEESAIDESPVNNSSGLFLWLNSVYVYMQSGINFLFF